jgi:hypothetical protein
VTATYTSMFFQGAACSLMVLLYSQHTVCVGSCEVVICVVSTTTADSSPGKGSAVVARRLEQQLLLHPLSLVVPTELCVSLLSPCIVCPP